MHHNQKLLLALDPRTHDHEPRMLVVKRSFALVAMALVLVHRPALVLVHRSVLDRLVARLVEWLGRILR